MRLCIRVVLGQIKKFGISSAVKKPKDFVDAFCLLPIVNFPYSAILHFKLHSDTPIS